MNTNRPLELKSTAEVRKIFTTSADRGERQGAHDEMVERRHELIRLNGNPFAGNFPFKWSLLGEVIL